MGGEGKLFWVQTDTHNICMCIDRQKKWDEIQDESKIINWINYKCFFYL